MEQWNVLVNGRTHEIIFEGGTLFGKGKFRIDDQPVRGTAVLVKKVGMFYPIEIENSELFLKCDLKSHPVDMIQDGRYLAAGTPLEEEVRDTLRQSVEARDPLTAKDRSAMGSLLTFTVLTYVNMILFLIDASVTFPFSAIIPEIVLELFSIAEVPFVFPMAVGVLVSVALASVYLLLYWRARKNNSLWPVIVSLILVAMDTLVVLFLALDDFSYYMVDIAFHLWMLWSLAQLWRVRSKKRKELLFEENPVEYPSMK